MVCAEWTAKDSGTRLARTAAKDNAAACNPTVPQYLRLQRSEAPTQRIFKAANVRILEHTGHWADEHKEDGSVERSGDAMYQVELTLDPAG